MISTVEIKISKKQDSKTHAAPEARFQNTQVTMVHQTVQTLEPPLDGYSIELVYTSTRRAAPTK
eukprot:scaffold1817_cov63-Phaeocystis_antarctica.AAC.3